MKISVIIPVHNASATLEKCVKSVVDQTHEELDIILIENGSTDSSGELCQRIAKTDVRIRCFSLVEGSVSKARNVGLNHMIGEYYIFVDADDYISDTMCEKLIQKALQEKAEMTFCRINNVRRDGQISAAVEDNLEPFVREDRPDLWFSEGFRHGVWRILFLTSAFSTIRFNEKMNLHEDQAYFFECRKVSNRCSLVDEHLYYYLYNYDIDQYQLKKYYTSSYAEVKKEYAKSVIDYCEHFNYGALAKSLAFEILLEVYQAYYEFEESFVGKARALAKDSFWRAVTKKNYFTAYCQYHKLGKRDKIRIFLLRRQMFALFNILSKKL